MGASIFIRICVVDGCRTALEHVYTVHAHVHVCGYVHARTYDATQWLKFNICHCLTVMLDWCVCVMVLCT